MRVINLRFSANDFGTIGLSDNTIDGQPDVFVVLSFRRNDFYRPGLVPLLSRNIDFDAAFCNGRFRRFGIVHIYSRPEDTASWAIVVRISHFLKDNAGSFLQDFHELMIRIVLVLVSLDRLAFNIGGILLQLFDFFRKPIGEGDLVTLQLMGPNLGSVDTQPFPEVGNVPTPRWPEIAQVGDDYS